MLTNELTTLIENKVEARKSLDSGLLFRYRPPTSNDPRHRLSVSRKGVKPTEAEVENVARALRRVAMVHDLKITGPHMTDNAAVYYVWRISWIENSQQLRLF